MFYGFMLQKTFHTCILPFTLLQPSAESQCISLLFLNVQLKNVNRNK